MKKISLFRPYVSWLSILYVVKVLCGTQLAEGPVVRCFEKEFGRRFFKRNVVALNSGTSALELAYELAGIGPGDEVITPVLTCTATNLPLLHRGAKIVFADINETLNLDIQDVEKKITEKTKAIVFVHFGGNSSGLGQLLVLARRHGIRVIEDAAQVIGAPCLTWGISDFTCISLQAIKTLTAGDGGILLTKNDEDAARARRLRWFGYDRPLKQKLGDTDLTEAGYKYHMNDISAAIALGNLRRLDSILKKRDRVRTWYREEWRAQSLPLEYLHLYPWLTILVHHKARIVDSLLKAYGIGSGPYHFRNDKYSVFGGNDSHCLWVSADPKLVITREMMEGGIIRVVSDSIKILRLLPKMDSLENSYTLLPFHHRLTRKDIVRIVQIVKAGMHSVFIPHVNS